MIITVIGNDNRQQELAKLLNKHYDTIYLNSSEESKTIKSIIKTSDKIVLPLPVSRDKKTVSTTNISIEDITNNAKENAVIFAGMSDFIECKQKIIDYNLDETFTLKNAFYTAESAVALCILNTHFSLENARILILGNGRIGKYLSKLLYSFGSKISVSARKEKDFKYIKSLCFECVNSNKIEDLSNYDVIFNTVPHKIISDSVLRSVAKETLIIDLASKNSGLSATCNYIDAKALPAKHCCYSSAKALFEYLNEYLQSEK